MRSVSAWIVLLGFVLAGRIGAEEPPQPPPAGWSLREVIALAVQRNPDLAGARARAEAALARVGEAESAFFPQLGARITFARTDDPSRAFGMILSQRRFTFNTNFNRPGPTQDVRPEVLAAVPLFHGGQDYFRRQAAQAGARAARAEEVASRNAVIDAAAQAYYALLAAPEQVAVMQASLSAVRSALENARARFAAGAALKSDVLSLEARLQATEAAAVRARNAVELARSALRLVLALPATEEVAVSPAAEVGPTLPASFSDALARARTQRAELVAMRELVAAREAEVAAERAAFLPRVDLIGSYGQNATDLRLSSSRDNWFFGATAEVDLFSGFRTLQRLRAAEHNLEEARQLEAKTQAVIEHEVRVAFSNWEEARQRLEASEAAVAAAEEALRLVTEQYRAGTVIVTRYLEAEAARTEARSQAVAARYELNRSAATLRKAMGSWEEEMEP
ncbi:MAG: TolC family protein [Candidatus Binatia bacterium]|nr:TolC family protein [Candidatus Binatia bacterium]